ncbi:MAG: DUF3837 domain-containing protein [Roseburia sp.]|nr:DUF3837 domain-containing protein [Ruminococcus sp.]MCM1156354.1 DUF3837 domain-containing protein [Roseburia sp.]MCM1241914.1 DUF3837 domain-containing protein [Roseburia sp.]
MVTSLARQAVIIKCGNDTSILTGNYELAYAVGFLMNKADIPLPEEEGGDNGASVAIGQLREKVLQEYKNKKAEDEKMSRLLRMVRLYEPADEWDEQMDELLQKGLNEACPFDIHQE